MKIGLAWLNQIRSDVNTGGFTAETFDSFIAQLEASFHTEHTVQDGHKTITATGTISERGRTTPMGAWISTPFASTLFSASTGVWTVTSTMVTAYTYTLIGTTMLITGHITASILSLAATTLKIALPASAMVARHAIGTCAYNDNGTTGTGVIQADPNTGDVLLITKDLVGTSTFSASGGLTVAFQLSVEISGI